MANILECGKDIKVRLIGAMPRESYVDIAATFTRSEKSMDEIVEMPYNPKLVEKVVGMSHLATTEFDYFIFAVEGVSRVVETQLVRKRLASYLIKSGRVQKNGKRSYDIIKPSSLNGFRPTIKLKLDNVLINGEDAKDVLLGGEGIIEAKLNFEDLTEILEQWYNEGVKENLPEEDLRYMKPQGTEWKGLVAMNAHSWLDWLKIRVCLNAQHEHRNLALKFMKELKAHSPHLFKNAGASCVSLGYCPENEYQHQNCKGKVITHTEAKLILKDYMKNKKES